MRGLKTSSALAMKFTLYVIGVLLLLGLLVNGGFFLQRYRGEIQKLQRMPNMVGGASLEIMPLKTKQQIIETDHGIQMRREVRSVGKPIKMPLRDNITVMPLNETLLQELREHVVFRQLSQLDDERVLFAYQPTLQSIKIATVSHFMDTQWRLARIWLIASILIALLTFLIARRFVRHSLVSLRSLTDFVQQLDIHALENRLPLTGPEDDEIRKIASALNSTLDTIQQQTNSLKDFVSYASHELKTPLMAMNANLDLAEKTQDFGNFVVKQKSLLQRMNQLFESLLLLTKQEYAQVHFIEQDIIPLIHHVVDDVQSRYPERRGDIIVEYPISFIRSCDASMLSSILVNLLTNACKYSKPDETILLAVDTDGIRVEDKGIGIAPKDLSSIWGRFRKKQGDGYGLGLYLVKLFVEKHGWTITVASELGKGTTFRINF